MSRKNKRTKRNVRPAVRQETQRENVSYIPKEESPKGETFFKVVLTLMIVGILAVVVYFIVDGIINNNKEEDYLFDSKMYLTTLDVQAIINDNHGAISNDYLELAIEQYDGIDNILIIFYNGDYEELFEGAIKNRHISMVNHINNMRELMNESEIHEGFIYGGGYAIFYMDVSDPAVSNVWAELFSSVSPEDLPSLQTPLLIHVAISHPEYDGVRYVPSVDIVRELETIYETMETED